VIEPDGKLAGIVTVSDLLRLLAEQVPPPARGKQTKHVVKTKKVLKTKTPMKARRARA
jgi:CBS domain-containing protein